MTTSTHFTDADIADEKIVYYHDGTNNNDSISVKAVDAAAHESSAGTITVTATNNNGWLVLVKGFDHGPQVPAIYALESDALATRDAWLSNHSGQAEVLMLPTTVSPTVIARGDSTFVQDVLDSPYGIIKDPVTVSETKARLTAILTNGTNNDLKTLVDDHGGDMAYPGRVALTDAQKYRWRDICDAANQSNLYFREIKIDDFANALEGLKGSFS